MPMPGRPRPACWPPRSPTPLTTATGRTVAWVTCGAFKIETQSQTAQRAATEGPRPRPTDSRSYGLQLLALATAIAAGRHDALLIDDPVSHDAADTQALKTLCERHGVTIHTTSQEHAASPS
jgi:hypothetical protein